jgi:hypothetical protein
VYAASAGVGASLASPPPRTGRGTRAGTRFLARAFGIRQSVPYPAAGGRVGVVAAEATGPEMPVPLLGRKRPTTGHRSVAPDLSGPLEYPLNQPLPVP